MHLSQRFAGQVNDPLRVGFFPGRTLGVVCPTIVWGEVLPPWELVLLTWEVVLSTWEAWNALSLAECLLSLPELPLAWVLLLLVGGITPASWEPALLVAWEAVLLGSKAPLAWETLPSTWEIALSAWEAWEALSLVEHLTAWEVAELLPA